jgi:hypothetical protein
VFEGELRLGGKERGSVAFGSEVSGGFELWKGKRKITLRLVMRGQKVFCWM